MAKSPVQLLNEEQVLDAYVIMNKRNQFFRSVSIEKTVVDSAETFLIRITI